MPGVVPPSGIDSIGRQRPLAHSVLGMRDAVQPLPMVLPVIGVSTQRPDAMSHLRVPQSASLTQIGMHAKTVSSRLTGRQATSGRRWHLATGAAGRAGPRAQDSKQKALELAVTGESITTQVTLVPQMPGLFVQSTVHRPLPN